MVFRIITRSYCEATDACELVHSKQDKKDGTKYAYYKLTIYNVRPEISEIVPCLGPNTLLSETIVANLKSCNFQDRLKVPLHFQGTLLI